MLKNRGAAVAVEYAIIFAVMISVMVGISFSLRDSLVKANNNSKEGFSGTELFLNLPPGPISGSFAATLRAGNELSVTKEEFVKFAASGDLLGLPFIIDNFSSDSVDVLSVAHSDNLINITPRKTGSATLSWKTESSPGSTTGRAFISVLGEQALDGGASFGFSVATNGNLVIIGDPDKGVVKIASESGGVWSIVDEITPPGDPVVSGLVSASARDTFRFGQSVAISENGLRIAISEPAATITGDHGETRTEAGVVHIYKNNAGVYQYENTLVDKNSFVSTRQLQYFGGYRETSGPLPIGNRSARVIDFSPDGQKIAIGIPSALSGCGEVQIFTASGSSISPLSSDEISSPQSCTVSKSRSGRTVSFGKNFLVVGEPGTGDRPGAAFVYKETLGAFALTGSIFGESNADMLGVGVLSKDNFIAAASPQGNTGKPYARLFRIAGFSSDGSARMDNVSPADSDRFEGRFPVKTDLNLGVSVMLTGQKLILSVPGEDTGGIDIFSLVPGNITRFESFKAGIHSRKNNGMPMGYAAALGGNTMVFDCGECLNGGSVIISPIEVENP